MKNSKLIIWALVAIVIVAMGFLIMRPAGGVKNVDSAELQALMDQGVRVIDVRTPGEFAAGRIPGTENVPLNELEAAATGWDKSQPIAVYCAVGDRSASAVEYLASQGFGTIYHLPEGIVAWTGQVESGQAVARAVSVETSGTAVMYEFFTGW